MSNGDSFSVGDGHLEENADESNFKEYRRSDGTILRFTKEEFGQIVDAFRMLLDQDKLNSQKNK